MMPNENNNHHDDDDDDEKDLGQHSLLMGTSADLAGLRNDATRSTALEQRGIQGTDCITEGIPCLASCQDDSETTFDKIEGQVFVTTAQLLFVANDATIGSEHDMAIGACSIQLHALQDEPEHCLYLQVGLEGDDDAHDGGALEVSFVPSKEEDGQTLFKALCKLVSRYPVEIDDEQDGGGMMMGGDGSDDDFIWAPSEQNGFDDDGEEGGASAQERQEMLERLDNMLVVDPQYEIQDGQFDDADEQ